VINHPEEVVESNVVKNINNENDSVFVVFSFLISILGVIFGLVYLDSNPERSKKCFIGAAGGFLFGLALMILYFAVATL
jgi:hypothetical protein